MRSTHHRHRRPARGGVLRALLAPIATSRPGRPPGTPPPHAPGDRGAETAGERHAPGPVEVFWEQDGCVRHRVVDDLGALLRELRRPGGPAATDVEVRPSAGRHP